MQATDTPPKPEQRFVLSDVSWGSYRRLREELGDRPVRVTFCRGELELMTPSRFHERSNRLLGRLIGIALEEADMPFFEAGSTTFSREDVEQGLEPDDCFFLRHVEEALAEEASDTPPDLAIEVDVTRSSLNRMSIYAALGVPEVWRFDGQSILVYCLCAHGTYEPSESSIAIPFLPPAKVAEFLLQARSQSDTKVIRAFRTWVRSVIS